MTLNDPFGARALLGPGLPDYYKLSAIRDDLNLLPVTIKILLEEPKCHRPGPKRGAGLSHNIRHRSPPG